MRFLVPFYFIATHLALCNVLSPSVIVADWRRRRGRRHLPIVSVYTVSVLERVLSVLVAVNKIPFEKQ